MVWFDLGWSNGLNGLDWEDSWDFCGLGHMREQDGGGAGHDGKLLLLKFKFDSGHVVDSIRLNQFS